MRNFVAKNDFNRASTHKSEKDYTRLSKYDLELLVMEELEDFGDEDEFPIKDPGKWESSKMKEVC